MIAKTLSAAALLGGILLCLLATCARAPGLYDGLWEDEIHYHAPVFLAPDLKTFRADIGPIMKPFLDFAIRRWLWFSRWGFTVSEQRLALVSLIYAAVHLLIWMLVPWTPYLSLRILAVLLLGLCPLESRYSTEAQGYSFYSLAPTVMFFAFLLSCRLLRQKKSAAGLGVFIAALAFYLNSHFFAWPSAFMLVAIFAAYVALDGTLKTDEKKKICLALAAGVTATGLFTIIADKPGLYFLLYRTPAHRAGGQWEWKWAFENVQQAWTWFSIPPALYGVAAAAGLAHPLRSKRYAAWGAFAAITFIKVFLILAMNKSSSYGIADRYLIMFIGPSILAFVLGIESLAAWAESWRPGTGHVITLGLLSFIVLRMGWPSLRNVAASAKQGAIMMQRMPPDYSPTYEFFERVKSYNRPALILTNHCWATDIPKMYMARFGNPSLSRFTVLQTSESCETPPADMSNQIRDFLAENRQRGIAVYFFEENESGRVPCGLGPDPLYRRPGTGCVGIVSAERIKTLRP